MATGNKNNKKEANPIQSEKRSTDGRKSGTQGAQRKTSISKRSSTPKMIGKQKVNTKGNSLAKKPSGKVSPRRKIIQDIRNAKTVYEGFRKSRPNRYRSYNVSQAKRVEVPGRHWPKDGRSKTGWWRPARTPEMTDAQYVIVKALTKMPEKWMSKKMRDASRGKEFYGKEGPGHSGYGTGAMQFWTDYIWRQNKGLDPHQISMYHVLKNAATAFAYHIGDKTFNQRMKEAEKNPGAAMNLFIDRLKEAIPELQKLSKRDIKEVVQHREFLVTFGPDGRAK